ncbi:HK97 family phage prohead protease [Dyadobacter sandarakinus]|uniref:HK97 family phage prohead protease n=1 Tax=Dyadobacter sandarakinus TaxID=2747268 RepID=A0ABX7I1R0_9BACT|nr:HK97 family phage prohead protease [Dyadobacter sandarakinus]QRQ99709.1 HK97 family phage prohead protease [Dyadobacter sandarakinus]
MEKELRFQPVSSPKIETRENGKDVISGMGVVFGQRSENLGGFYEYIDKDAFAEADMSDVVGLFNHDSNYVLGRSSSGTMRFNIQPDGIYYEIDAPSTQTIRDLVLEPMKRGDIKGSSFAFTIAEDGDSWEYDKANQVYIRHVKKVSRLYDLSAVTTPAYPASTSQVAKRSLDAFKEELEKREKQAQEQNTPEPAYKLQYAQNRLKLITEYTSSN